jgi:diaminopimelate epimerase
VRVELGRPSFRPELVPVLDMRAPALAQPLSVAGRELTVSCLNNGNPHAVVMSSAEELSAELAGHLGPLVAGHARFPNRVNVEFLHVLDRGTIRIEIFERAAGYTLASGSSACAAAAVAHALGLVDQRIEVLMPGGRVRVCIDETGGVALTGVVQQVMTGRFAPALRARLGIAEPSPSTV